MKTNLLSGNELKISENAYEEDYLGFDIIEAF